MSVDAVSAALASTTPSVNTGAAQGNKTLGKDDFLKLLVAQLSHQDPLKPQEGAEFVAELAQFSNLEQLMGANDKLSGLSQLSSIGEDSQAMTLVGKTVTYDTKNFSLDGIGTKNLQMNLPSATIETKVEVIDAGGNVVRTIDAGAAAAGDQTLAFDGVGDDGSKLAAGSYSFRVKAKDSAGRLVAAITTHTGKVTAVTRNGTKTELNIGDAAVSLSDVTKVQ